MKDNWLRARTATLLAARASDGPAAIFVGSGSGEAVTDIWRGTGPASLCTRRLSCQYNANWRWMHHYSSSALLITEDHSARGNT